MAIIYPIPALIPANVFEDFMKQIIDLTPFSVPNFVIAKGGVPIPLSYLNYEALDELCNQFRSDVFEKAGKQDLSKVSE